MSSRGDTYEGGYLEVFVAFEDRISSDKDNWNNENIVIHSKILVEFSQVFINIDSEFFIIKIGRLI